MPAGSTGAYSVGMPTGHQGKYKALLPNTVTIDMAGAPPGASWTLDDSVSEVATGTAGETVDRPPETYTLTWEDTAFPWVPPPPEGPTVLSAGSHITFGPP